MRPIVLIVDEHPLVGEALQLWVSAAYPKYQVVHVASAAEADEHAQRHAHRIRLVLLDFMLSDAHGFGAVLGLQQRLPDAAVVVISSRLDAHSVSMARAFGVRGYLSKAASVSSLMEAVGAILEGASLFPESAGKDPAATEFHRKIARLSAAQLRVLRAVSDGKLNKQIAGDMSLTEGTVKQHMSAILRKLEVVNRSQAILAAAPFLRDERQAGRR